MQHFPTFSISAGRERARRASARAPRVLFGGIYHESHTFVEGATRADEMGWASGEAVCRMRDDATPLGGALRVGFESSWEVLPGLHLLGGAGPMVADECVERWWREWRAIWENGGGADAIFLALHGAMVSPSFADVEGEILGRLRELVGPDVLIAGATDLHANYSAAMARNADVLVTYRENPHTDGLQTGERAARLLGRALEEGRGPRTALAAPGLVWTPPETGTADPPMRALESLARELENAHPDFWCVNVHGGFAFADTPDTGVSFSICTSGEADDARRALEILCDLAWEKDAQMESQELELDDLLVELDQALREPSEGPIVIAEPSDNVGGGAPGDNTHLLRAILEHRFAIKSKMRVGAILCDARAIERCAHLKIGEKMTLRFGGWAALSGEPLEMEVELMRHSDGHFGLFDPLSHLASAGTTEIEMGPSALFRARPPANPGLELWLLVNTIATPPMDLGQWHCVGVQPEALDLILVKAAVSHEQAYRGIASRMLWVSTPGACASDLSLLPFVKCPILADRDGLRRGKIENALNGHAAALAVAV